MGAHQDRLISAVRAVWLDPGLGRPELAARLDVNLSTVSALVHELVEMGLLRTSGTGASSGGRPAARLEVVPEAAMAVGAELSHRGVRTALVDFCGRVVDRREPVHPGRWERAEMLRCLRGELTGLLGAHPGRHVAGIGIGVGGLVGPAAGISRDFPNVPDWKDVDLATELGGPLGMDVFVENDVRAATLAELRWGAGRGLCDFFYLHIGRGIALGMVLGGRLHAGSGRASGELGHFQVDPNGPVCYCGSAGCLESLAAPRALLAQAAEALRQGVKTSLSERVARPEDLAAEDLFAAADAGDRLARNLVERAGEAIGRLTAGLDTVLDPQAIVLGGLLSGGASVLAECIMATHRARVMPLVENTTEFRSARLGTDAPAIGAAAAVFERAFELPERLLPGAAAARPRPAAEGKTPEAEEDRA